MSIEFGDISKAMRVAFGRCPECNEKTIVHGHWLKWCSVRSCGWLAPMSREQREALYAK